MDHEHERPIVRRWRQRREPHGLGAAPEASFFQDAVVQRVPNTSNNIAERI